MASGRNFSRRQRAGRHSPHAGDGFDLAIERPTDEVIRDLKDKELIARSDHDGVRLEKLARAQQLVADANYPPAEVLESVAKLLAKHLQPGTEG